MGFFRKKKKQEEEGGGAPVLGVVVGASAPLAVASGNLAPIPVKNQPVELGTIHYVNLTADGRHGDLEKALQVASESGKPIFANFVEWSG